MSKVLFALAIAFTSIATVSIITDDRAGMKKDHATFKAEHEAMAKKHDAVQASHAELHKLFAKLIDLMKSQK